MLSVWNNREQMFGFANWVLGLFAMYMVARFFMASSTFRFVQEIQILFPAALPAISFGRWAWLMAVEKGRKQGIQEAQMAAAAEPASAVEDTGGASREGHEWTEAELLELLAEYDRGGVTQDVLGARHGISGRRVGQLLSRARDISKPTSSSAAIWTQNIIRK